MGMLINEADIEAFERDGAICLRRVFDAHWLGLICEGIEKEIGAPGTGFVEQQDRGVPGRFVTDYCPAQRIKEFQEFVTNSPAAEIAGRAMRSLSARILMDVLWIK